MDFEDELTIACIHSQIWGLGERVCCDGFPSQGLPSVRSLRSALPKAMAARQFARSQHDEILVNGLQRRVGQPSPAVQKRASPQKHVKKPDEWPKWQRIEELLLVLPSFFEPAAEQGASKGSRLGAIFEHHSGFEIGILDMSLKPEGNAFAERIMVEITSQVFSVAIYDCNRIYEALVSNPLRPKEANVIRSELSVF
jgi:hypothetical protein